MIIAVVDNLVKRYGTSDPFELCQMLGIKILKEPLGNIKGFYQYCARNKFIHINNSLHDIEKKLVLSHELGHAVLHPRINIIFIQRETCFIGSRYESEAEIFATCLILKSLDNAELLPTTFYEVSMLTGIPQKNIQKVFD